MFSNAPKFSHKRAPSGLLRLRIRKILRRGVCSGSSDPEGSIIISYKNLELLFRKKSLEHFFPRAVSFDRNLAPVMSPLYPDHQQVNGNTSKF